MNQGQRSRLPTRGITSVCRGMLSKLSCKKIFLINFAPFSLGLGKEGVYSLGAEIRGALEHKVGQYTSVPSNVEIGRRNTVFGAESIPNTNPNPRAVKEGPSALKGATGLGRSMSTRLLGLRVEVPHGMDTARSSMATLNMVPPTSAASTATLFEDFEAGLNFGPQAESTPHNTSSKPPRQAAPPPLPAQNRHTKITYTKSEDHDTPTNPSIESTPQSTVSSLTQWSSWAVGPLIPKTSKLQRKMSNQKSGTASGNPSKGLRQLSLLQNRNMNPDTTGPVVGVTRPLSLGKKQKLKPTAPVQDENARPDSNSTDRSRKLRPLMLARSDTSKVRGIMRKQEALPDVVVRPPSMTDHNGFAYSFRD